MSQEIKQHTEVPKQAIQTTCCIVGGGPAGMILAYMLARQGIEVHVLESHMNFDREFRGDTIHPSVLTILDELGLIDQLLELPHAKVPQMSFLIGDERVNIASFQHLKVKYPYIMVLPQARFLEFIAEQAKKFSNFHLIMGAQANDLIEENGKICGVRYRGQDGTYEVRAILTVGADGRFSRLRKLAGFEPVSNSQSIDVLWMSVSRRPDETKATFGRLLPGRMVLAINRDSYWQLGMLIPKGHYQQIRAQGLEHLRHLLATSLPDFAEHCKELQNWHQISLLSVESSYIQRWYRPGLLLIGDAAHVMSPVGGVGINFAIQDAVVAANILGSKLRYGVVHTADLARVQQKRELLTRIIQKIQEFIQRTLFAAVFSDTNGPITVPPFIHWLPRIPVLRNLPAQVIGMGIVPVHVAPQLRKIDLS